MNKFLAISKKTFNDMFYDLKLMIHVTRRHVMCFAVNVKDICVTMLK